MNPCSDEVLLNILKYTHLHICCVSVTPGYIVYMKLDTFKSEIKKS